jgi:CheY-like chemotaxis protein
MSKNILAPITLLIADDDRHIHQEFAKILSGILPTGSEVYSAPYGNVFMDKFNEREYSAVILDRMMPMNHLSKVNESQIKTGTQLYKYVRSKNQNIPIVFFSAYMDTEFMLSFQDENLAFAQKEVTTPLEMAHILFSLMSDEDKFDQKINFLVEDGWKLHSQINNIQNNVRQIQIELSELKEVA